MFDKILEKKVSRKKFLAMLGIGVFAVPFLAKGVFADWLFRNETNTYNLGQLVNTTQVKQFTIQIDTTQGLIQAGQTRYIQAKFAGTIKSWTVFAKESGNIQFDVWKTTYAALLPTVADSIITTGYPLLSSQQKNTSTDLSGWTSTTINTGDVLGFNIMSATGLTEAYLVIEVEI